MTNYLQQILTYFRNMALNAAGAERDLLQFIQDKDISSAIRLMQDRDSEVDNALNEYNPQTHDVMRRPNKYRRGDEPYISEKLPRTRQRYINEVELFFLLGNPILWKKEDGDDKKEPEYRDVTEVRTLNSMVPLWKKPASEVTDEQYADFSV